MSWGWGSRRCRSGSMGPRPRRRGICWGCFKCWGRCWSGGCSGRRPALPGARGAAGVASWPAGFVGGHVTPLDGDGPVLVGPPSMGAALPGRSLAVLVGPWPGPGHLSEARGVPGSSARTGGGRCRGASGTGGLGPEMPGDPRRSEEHTSELQSRENLVCRLLLEKKKKIQKEYKAKKKKKNKIKKKS